MNFGQKDRPVIKANSGNTFALSPTSFSVELSQPGDLPNCGPDRKRFGVVGCVNYLGRSTTTILAGEAR